jgi:hypothetical protein
MRTGTHFLYRFCIVILTGPVSTRSRHNVIGIVNCLQIGKSGFEVRQNQETHLQYFQIVCGTHPASYSITSGIFAGLKWPEREADNSPPSSAKSKSVITPLLPLHVFMDWAGTPWALL